MAVRTHHLDIYGVDVHLATSRRDWSTLRRRFDFLERDDTERYLGLTVYATRNGGKRYLFFWIAPELEGAQLVGTCAHEASHAAGRILASIGHTVDETDEPHAYLIEWLARWLWEHCS